MKNIFTIPNMLSTFRLCLIPFITTTYTQGAFTVATLLLVVSGLTDMLDGMIARRFGQISEFGKFIDPLADKLTMASVVFALLLHHPPLWVTLSVLVAKELLTLVGAYVLYKKGTRPSESKLFGKLSTFFLYVILFLIMVADILEERLDVILLYDWVVWGMVAISCLLMILAFCQYLPIFIGIIKGTYNVETEQFEGDSKHNDT